MKKIVFRVDSGFHMGIGHVMRCLTLARELKDIFEIHFITKNHLGSNLGIISADFPTHVIKGGLENALLEEEKSDYKNWLGTSQEVDAKETNSVMEKLGNVELIVIDHYSLDEVFEKNLYVPKIAVVDDLMNRSHDCDLLLDQNISALESKYKTLVSDRCKELLMGPMFAMLRPEFKIEHKSIKSDHFEKDIKHIVVFFGASDVKRDTLKFIKNVMPTFGNSFQFSFILSDNHQDFQTCKDLVKLYPNCDFMSFSLNFTELMKSADLFIGAGGTTSWERACLGVASALMSVALNQKLVCEKLEKEKICFYLGDSDDMNSDKWFHFFDKIVPQITLWYDLRKNSYALVDGSGATKVASSIKKILND